MQCPFCRVDDTKVIDSRLVGEGEQVRRRRECVCCQERFTTYEIIEISLPRLIKQDGSSVAFDEQKLRTGILRAIEKRQVSMDLVDRAVSSIMHKLRECGEREVSTRIIGEWAMQELKQLDEVAYVRFASVYRRFEDVEAFREEIERLKNTETITE